MEKPVFHHAEAAWEPEIFAIYRSLVGTPYCLWTDDYPERKSIAEDLAARAIYVLEEQGAVIAVASIYRVTEHDGHAPWRGKNPCDLMRIGVRREKQGRGLGHLLMAKLIEAARETGYDTMRIHVGKTNLPAQKLYRGMGAEQRGENFSYGVHWDCLEIALHP